MSIPRNILIDNDQNLTGTAIPEGDICFFLKLSQYLAFTESGIIKAKMKYPFIILLLLVLVLACSRDEPAYEVRQGENIFKPIMPSLPFFGKVFQFDLTLGEEWWDGDLTNPVGFGCKLHSVGKLNYHKGGANFAVTYCTGHVYLSPRYYEPITEGTYKLHELPYLIELHPEVPVKCRIEFYDSTNFYVDGKLVVTIPVKLPHDWISPPFLGRSGHDQNYPQENIPRALASRNLGLRVIM